MNHFCIRHWGALESQTLYLWQFIQEVQPRVGNVMIKNAQMFDLP